MLHCCTFSCTSTHTSCYAAARSLALSHIRHATLLHVLLHFHTYVMLRCCTFSCTSTHTSCYAAARSLALPHIRHATLLHVLLHFHMLLHGLLHFHTYVMLWARTACCADCCKAWKGASKQQVPEKRHKWQNVAHNRGEFVKHLGRKPKKKSSTLAGTQTLDRQWDKQIGSTCMLQSGARASKAMSWTTSDNFVLKGKKELFGETLDEQNSNFPLLKWPFQGICTRNLFHK